MDADQGPGHKRRSGAALGQIASTKGAVAATEADLGTTQVGADDAGQTQPSNQGALLLAFSPVMGLALTAGIAAYFIRRRAVAR